MRTGSIYDVVEVLKSLTFLAQSKNLSFREKRMLDRAKFLVISEISEVVAREERTGRTEGRQRARALLLDQDPLASPARRPPRLPRRLRITVKRTAKAS